MSDKESRAFEAMIVAAMRDISPEQIEEAERKNARLQKIAEKLAERILFRLLKPSTLYGTSCVREQITEIILEEIRRAVIG